MSKLYAQIQRARLLEQQHQAVAHALLEQGRDAIQARSAAGDEQRLRLIPVIGPTPGTIPNTRPDQSRITRR